MEGSEFCHWHKTGHGLWPRRQMKLCNAVCSAKRRAERRGLRCKNPAVRNYSKCRMHGGGSGGARKAFRSPEMRQHKRRAEIEESDRLYELWLKKQRQPKPIIWPSEGRHQTPTLEDSFRAHHRRRDKGWTPY